MTTSYLIIRFLRLILTHIKYWVQARETCGQEIKNAILRYAINEKHGKPRCVGFFGSLLKLETVDDDEGWSSPAQRLNTTNKLGVVWGIECWEYRPSSLVCRMSHGYDDWVDCIEDQEEGLLSGLLFQPTLPKSPLILFNSTFQITYLFTIIFSPGPMY